MKRNAVAWAALACLDRPGQLAACPPCRPGSPGRGPEGGPRPVGGVRVGGRSIRRRSSRSASRRKAARNFAGAPAARPPVENSTPRSSRRCSRGSSAAVRTASSNAAVRVRGDRLGLRLRRPGPHPDQQPRRRGGREDHRHVLRRRRADGQGRRDRPQGRRRGHQGRHDRLPPPAEGQEQQVRVGEWVMAVGSPFGFEPDGDHRDHLGHRPERRPHPRGRRATSPSSRPTRRSTRATRAARWSTWTAGDRDQLGDRHRRPAPTPGSASPSRSTWPASLADKLIKDGKVSPRRSASSSQPLTPALATQLGIDRQDQGRGRDRGRPGSPADKAGLKQGSYHHPLRR